MKVVLIILCYLIGSIPFSFIFSELIGGIDIRKRGSRNVGATNAFRTGGVKIALPALMGDVLKGVAAAWIGSAAGSDSIIALCCAAAVVGHCWPVFLGFKGGKGVATCAGIILYLSPLMLVALLIIFALITLITRYVSLASICVAALVPAGALILHQSRPLIYLGIFLAVLVITRHHQNIVKLLTGTEAKITEKATS